MEDENLALSCFSGAGVVVSCHPMLLKEAGMDRNPLPDPIRLPVGPAEGGNESQLTSGYREM